MWYAVKRLLLGVVLIGLASGILLGSDWLQRRSVETRPIPRVALFQYSTRPLMDDAVRGALKGLAAKGYEPGKTMQLERFNAENDLPTANSMARAVLDGNFDLVLTISTPCLQTMASANRAGKLTHVFAAVTDPFGAGVGISREDPLDHPAWLAGIGTFQPVRDTFLLAKQLYPDLKTVGVTWNPAEACSEACVMLARETCQELGITLLEAQVDNSSGVLEASSSLVARGVQALYLGGDNTVELAIDSLVKSANQGRIPVFNNSPDIIAQGCLFGLGANYSEVGRIAGELAGDILNGRDPATIPIEDVVPRRLAFNLAVLATLRDPWTLSDDVRADVALLVEEDGTVIETQTATSTAGTLLERPNVASSSVIPTPNLTKVWTIDYVNFVEADHVEETHQGFFEEFARLGLVEGRDYRMNVKNAQGDMATLTTLVDAELTSRPDLILLTSTPTLQAVVQKVKDIPVLFSNVSNPIVAGAGKSDDDHLPNVTGISSQHDWDGMVRMLQQCVPRARRIGTLFCPSEVNSVYGLECFEKAVRQAGLELISVASTSSAEVPTAALSLAAKGVDVICQIPDNLHDVAFTSIVQVARQEKLPLFAFMSGLVRHKGGAVSWARDYHSAGQDKARLAVRIMNGESPADIPFRPISKVVMVVNLPNAAACGLDVPASILEQAEEVIR